MLTSSAKSKGRRLAQKVREMLLSWAPDDLSPEDIVVTPSGVTGPDLYLSPAAKKVYWLSIECKNQESLNIWSALKQAESHVKGDEVPLLAFTRNRAPAVYVALKLEDFLRLTR